MSNKGDARRGALSQWEEGETTQRVGKKDNRMGKQGDQNSMKGYPEGFHQREADTLQPGKMQPPYKSM